MLITVTDGQLDEAHKCDGSQQHLKLENFTQLKLKCVILYQRNYWALVGEG